MGVGRCRQFSPVLTLQSSLLPSPSPDSSELPTPASMPCSLVPWLSAPSLWVPLTDILAGFSDSPYPPNPAPGPASPTVLSSPPATALGPQRSHPCTFVLLIVSNIWKTSGFACPLPGPVGGRLPACPPSPPPATEVSLLWVGGGGVWMRKSCWADLRLLKEGMAEVREGSARSQIQNNSYGPA